jgi:flagellar assembly protein FliH
MTNASRFLFEHDFRGSRGGDAKHQAALAEAEARGRAAGFVEGMRQAQADSSGRLADALRRLAEAAATLLAEADARHAALEEDAVAFALELGRKLAGEALRVDALGPIAEAARAAFQHLRGVPHLVVRVNETQVEEVDRLMRRLSRERGFEGRIVVLGEPDVAAGDARLEWADGAVVREQARIADAVADQIAESRPTPAPSF